MLPPVLRVLIALSMCTRYVIECQSCGVIYRSRKHWYGNKDPEQAAVKTENKHVWPEVVNLAIVAILVHSEY